MNLAKTQEKILVILIGVLSLGCLSPDFTVTTSGTFSGTYVSFEGTYTGPMSFDFDQVEEDIDVEGVITVNDEVIEFAGDGTMRKNPARLEMDVEGTGFSMHVEGEVTSNHLSGSYWFNSNKWGKDEGSVDLGSGD